MQQTVYRKSQAPLPAPRELTGAVAAAVLSAPVALFDGLLAWQRRNAERAQLLRLTDHQLRDLGLTREQTEEMARKLRWSRPI